MEHPVDEELCLIRNDYGRNATQKLATRISKA